MLLSLSLLLCYVVAFAAATAACWQIRTFFISSAKYLLPCTQLAHKYATRTWSSHTLCSYEDWGRISWTLQKWWRSDFEVMRNSKHTGKSALLNLKPRNRNHWYTQRNIPLPIFISFWLSCSFLRRLWRGRGRDASIGVECLPSHPHFHGPCPFPFPCLDTWRPSPLALPFMRAHYAIYRSLNAAHKANAGLLVLGLLASCWAGTGAGMDRAGERPSCDPHATWTWVEVPIGPGWGSPAIIVLGYHCNQLMEVITCQALGFRLPL